jgi:hypothetical protein
MFVSRQIRSLLRENACNEIWSELEGRHWTAQFSRKLPGRKWQSICCYTSQCLKIEGSKIPLHILFPGLKSEIFDKSVRCDENGQRVHQEVSTKENDARANGASVCWLTSAGRRLRDASEVRCKLHHKGLHFRRVQHPVLNSKSFLLVIRRNFNFGLLEIGGSLNNFQVFFQFTLRCTCMMHQLLYVWEKIVLLSILKSAYT